MGRRGNLRKLRLLLETVGAGARKMKKDEEGRQPRVGFFDGPDSGALKNGDSPTTRDAIPLKPIQRRRSKTRDELRLREQYSLVLYDTPNSLLLLSSSASLSIFVVLVSTRANKKAYLIISSIVACVNNVNNDHGCIQNPIQQCKLSIPMYFTVNTGAYLLRHNSIGKKRKESATFNIATDNTYPCAYDYFKFRSIQQHRHPSKAIYIPHDNQCITQSVWIHIHRASLQTLYPNNL
eukprot:scaffold12482_cov138-Skeletonema_menzelii.AAC.3